MRRRDARLSGSYVLARAVADRQIVPCAVTPALVGTGTPGDGGAILARLTELVERAHAGRFDVDPEPCDPYCAFRGVCRYQEPPLAEEEAEDG